MSTAKHLKTGEDLWKTRTEKIVNAVVFLVNVDSFNSNSIGIDAPPFAAFRY